MDGDNHNLFVLSTALNATHFELVSETIHLNALTRNGPSYRSSALRSLMHIHP